MQIILASKEITNQLIGLCSKLTSDQYSKSFELLMNNSIGKHVRHIVEFNDLLKESNTTGELSYDNRVHCEETETCVNKALERLNSFNQWIDKANLDLNLKLKLGYDKNSSDSIAVDSSMKRELAYNLEHAIHHMAIIRIVVEKELKSIKLDDQFGVAYSTIRFKDDTCAR